MTLFRAVLAASSVFDMAIVVVNADKGIEQQTAEHLLLVSILCPEHVIIVINKVCNCFLSHKSAKISSVHFDFVHKVNSK